MYVQNRNTGRKVTRPHLSKDMRQEKSVERNILVLRKRSRNIREVSKKGHQRAFQRRTNLSLWHLLNACVVFLCRRGNSSFFLNIDIFVRNASLLLILFKTRDSHFARRNLYTCIYLEEFCQSLYCPKSLIRKQVRWTSLCNGNE